MENSTKETDNNSLNNFAYTDIKSNLKIRLEELIKNQVVFSFNEKMEILETLRLIEHFECHTKICRGR